MISIGEKVIYKPLEEGWYQGEVKKVQEGKDITLHEDLKLPTVEITYTIDLEENYKIDKSKTYIVSQSKGSEMYKLTTNLLSKRDEKEGHIDLLELVGKKCQVEIKIDYSKAGNRYENIGRVKGVKDHDNRKYI